MKKVFAILTFFLTPFLLKAQDLFKTIVPTQPVIAGESFQVQYVIRGAGKVGNFTVPPFAHFRFVSGPNQYNGSVTTLNGDQPLKNFVFTLEAIKPGRFIIPGAIVTINGKLARSNDVAIEIITKEEAAKFYDRNIILNSDYILRPGEDPYEKIKQNLFLKVMVDRKNCFTGEPVLATFKLYSRLESKSDIVKNPGFYGFTVYDMVNLADKQVATENVNGKMFDVHTIRKVQLFPLQAGTFIIDAMEVKNKVEFSRSTIGKKTEQEIIEGVLENNDDDTNNENTEVFETNINTMPVVINVRPLPAKNKPSTYNGAVGNFTISGSVVKDSLAKNEEGFLKITMSGSGNFTQLNAPVIEWPAGIEGFEPVIKDSLDKSKLPLAGSRTFRYSFICSHPGNYQLPSTNFSFFDPGKNIFKTISTGRAQIKITNEGKKNVVSPVKKISIADINVRASRMVVVIVVLLVLLVLIYLLLHKNKIVAPVETNIPEWTSIDEILFPVQDASIAPDKEFYKVLHHQLWKYLGNRLELDGSEMNKVMITSQLNQKDIDDTIILRLQKILADCEAIMFTTAILDINKEKTLLETKNVLESIDAKLL